MGIAPLVYLADSLVDMGCQVEVFYGAETCGELVALERLEQTPAVGVPAMGRRVPPGPGGGPCQEYHGVLEI